MLNVHLPTERPIFKKCLEALGVSLLSKEESSHISTIFDEMFPLDQLGKIDWDKIDNKIDVGYDPENIIPSLERLLGTSVINTSVYIIWSSARYPAIKADLNKIIECFESVTSISPDKFIFNLEFGYVLEILVSDQMTIGLSSSVRKI